MAAPLDPIDAVELRERAQVLKRQRKTYREIAQDLHVSKRTVERWLAPGAPEFKLWSAPTNNLKQVAIDA